MQKEKRNKGLVKAVLDKASYSVGFLCAKTAKMGGVARAKSWKKTVSVSKDLVEKAGEKTQAFIHDAKEGASHIKESFISGFESAKEVKKKTGAITEAKTSKIRKKLSPQEKKKKIKALSETREDPDIEKEIKKIDEEVADVS